MHLTRKTRTNGRAGIKTEIRKERPFFKYLAGLLLFGSNGVVASFIDLSSYEIVLLRSVLGAALLVCLFFITGYRFTAFRHTKDLMYIVVSGVAMAADWLLLFEAYARIGVSMGMLINYTGPAIVIALSPIFLKERTTFAKVIALVAALLGAILISGQAAVAGMNVGGLICAGLSAVAYAVMVLLNKMAREITGIENAAVQILCTAVVVAAFVGCKQGFFMKISGNDWFPILLLGLVNTGVGCYFFFSSLSSLSAQTVAICGYLEPLFAVLLSVMILHETMTPLQISGAVLIIGGAVFGECYGRGKSFSEGGTDNAG